MNKNNEDKISTVSEINKINISNKDSHSINVDHKNCSYCNEPFIERLWCKECDPRRIIEGWTSGNHDIDKFIKDTIYNSRKFYFGSFIEWVPFDRLKNVKQIGGEFSKIYSATWIDGQATYNKQGDGSWKKLDPKPIEVALKRLNGAETITNESLNEIKIHWDLYSKSNTFLEFYGITKDPETKEFMMIIQFANQGNLRYILSKYCHKNVHSGNILQDDEDSYISNLESAGPSNKQRTDNKIFGVLPYIAPEVLYGEPYTLSSDIYSFGVIMAEISSEKPPFYERKHDTNLASEICNGVRPEFGNGTPEIYKKLAYRCMNADSNQRPTANELHELLYFWRESISFFGRRYLQEDRLGYEGKEIQSIFKKANNVEVDNTSYEIDADAIYTSRIFTFSNLPKPVNSSIIITYLNNDENKD
ncbi:kinase-like domain-containing protein [Rhizophagus clarus]|uniref:Kinase-like domain-containing protein n=1 Tax=Rhizophagus clarus TaxID=94130 RepID=A0A8H3L6J7_9GLOM|nr:kinase-like domain-containing protein [Rhizophagus clarus]